MTLAEAAAYLRVAEEDVEDLASRGGHTWLKVIRGRGGSDRVVMVHANRKRGGRLIED